MLEKASKVLALIPARGGSKGIPRKNVLEICGKPMIAYSIEQALASDWIDRVIVSTDDEEIAAVAKAHGAEVPFLRPAEFARDESTDFEVFHHALQWLKENEKYECDLVVHLRPTGPARKVAVIDRAIEELWKHPEADCLRSVSLALQTPYKMWELEGGYMKPVTAMKGVAESYNLPRQKLPKVYWQNGYVDVVRPRTILELKLMSGRTILPFIMNETLFELDTLEDLPAIERALQQGGEEAGTLERFSV